MSDLFIFDRLVNNVLGPLEGLVDLLGAGVSGLLLSGPLAEEVGGLLAADEAAVVFAGAAAAGRIRVCVAGTVADL